MHPEHGHHSRLIRDLSSRSQNNNALRHAIYSGMILSAEPLVEKGTNPNYYWQLLRRSKQGLHTLKTFYTLIYKELDDRLDTMAPEDILALGSVTLGNKPCDFLHNFLTKEDWEAANSFSEKGVIPPDDLIILMNLFADVHVKGLPLQLP